MESLPTDSLFLTTLFPNPEPGQFALNWFPAGSNGKGNHVEAPNEQPPPIVFWQIAQVERAEERPQSWAQSRNGDA